MAPLLNSKDPRMTPLADRTAPRWWQAANLSFSPCAGILAHGVLLLALLIWPLWQTVVPPLPDYMNHLARMHILHSYADSPALQASYALRNDITPYAAMEGVVLPLLHLTDIYTAGKLFISLGMLLTVLGVVGIQVLTTGRVSLLSMFAQPFLYGFTLGWGFVPFTFAVGVTLCLFCGWLWLAERSYALRLVYLLVTATLLFFCHLICVGLYALLVACQVTARERWFSVGFFRQGLSFAPGFAGPVWLWTQVPPSPIPLETGRWQPLAAYVHMLDINQSPVHGMALLLLVVALYVGIREGALRISSPVLWRCLMVGGSLSLLVPWMLWGVAYMDDRLPYLLVLLLVGGCSVVPGLGAAMMRRVVTVTVVLGVVFAVRQVQMTQAFQTCGDMTQAFRNITADIPAGVRVLGVRDRVPGPVCGQPLWPAHLITLVAIDRDAFIGSLFLKLYNLDARPHLDDPGYGAIGMISRTDLVHPLPVLPQRMKDWRQNFDYVVIVHFDDTPDAPVPEGLHLMRRTPYFAVYRVEPVPTGVSIPASASGAAPAPADTSGGADASPAFTNR
jgi:hypothetical protein